MNVLPALHVGSSSRAHVSGHSACLGLSGPGHAPSINSMGGLAHKPLVLINSIFAWAAERMGVRLGWTSIQLNHNTISEWHIDKGNKGLSMMLVVGDFTGGEFEVGPSGPLDLRGKVIVFDGKESHASRSFTGNRWSLVAFTSYALGPATAPTLRRLRLLGFPGAEPHVPRPLSGSRYFLDLFAGAGAPLAFAVCEAGLASFFPMDASPRLGGVHHDILVPEVETLLRRLCASGRVALAAAGPPCSDYSKLRELPVGPPPVRSANAMLGLPGLNAAQTAQLQSSHAIHRLASELLQLVVDSGGHFVWENPPSSLALLEPDTQKLFANSRCEFVIVHACAFGLDLQKKWLFATTWPPLCELGVPCTHAHPHQSLRGKAPDGQWRSVASAVYPPDFANAFALVVSPLLSPGHGVFTSWLAGLGVPPADQCFRISCFGCPAGAIDIRRGPGGSAFPVNFGNPFKVQLLSRKVALSKFRALALQQTEKFDSLRGRALRCACRDHENCHGDIISAICNAGAAPVSSPSPPPERALCADGGGVPSSADWRRPPAGAPDHLRGLRRALAAVMRQHDLVARFLGGLSVQSKECPFPADAVSAARKCMADWLSAHGCGCSLEIRPNQPFLLDLLEALLKATADPDVTLTSFLKEGVPTGVLAPIPQSGVWRTASPDSSPAVELAECSSNWKSADDDAATAQLLVDEDIAAGFIREFKGSISDARQRWPAGVAVGKLGIAHAPGKPPRLIMDSTVAGVNPAAVILDKIFLPGLRDVVDTTSPEDPASVGFSMDVAKAHKRVVVKEDQWGLLLFTLQGRLYHYITCHFGATFSAYWWGRLGAALHRLLHNLLFSWHVGLLYVDDWLWRLRAQTAPLQACLLALFLSALGCPMSWHKLRLGPRLGWIGWHLDFDSLQFEVPDDKLTRVLEFLHLLSSSKKVERTLLRKGTGLLQWLAGGLRSLRPWLAEFYTALAKPAFTSFMLTREQLRRLQDGISADWSLPRKVQGCPMTPGMILANMSGGRPQTTAELFTKASPVGRVWTQWSDLDSKNAYVQPELQVVARQWARAIGLGRWRGPMFRPPPAPGGAAADAFASGGTAGIGGWFTLKDDDEVPLDVWWFSLSLSPSDFPAEWGMNADAQKDISCYELLAQVVLLVLRGRVLPPCSMGLLLPSGVDNQTAAAAGNKLFTTARPLTFFARCLSFWEAALRVESSLDYLPGARNGLADGLSRAHDSVMSTVRPERRLTVLLDDVLQLHAGPRLWPKGEPAPRALAPLLRSHEAAGWG